MKDSVKSKVVRSKRKRFRIFFAGFIAAMLCFVALNAAMKPVSTSEYCGGKCHEMHTAYQTWELSSHGTNEFGYRVECVDCHLPPKEMYFRHVIAKGYEGGKDIYKHYLGGEYDGAEARKRALEKMKNSRCLYCHDELMAMPGSPAARTAHAEVLSPPQGTRPKCVDCHEHVGHERENKLFSR